MELIPSLNHSTEGVTHAFLNRMLDWFGVAFKIFIHQGMEFHGEFQKLCEKTLIDLCTSWTNGSNGEMKFA